MSPQPGATGTGAPARRAALVLAGVIAFDQLTKALVRGSVAPGDERSVLPGIKLVHTLNHGIAFGVAAGGTALLALIVAVVVAGILVFFARNSRRALVWLPTGLLIGGAIGNLADRIREGAVTDFIKLPLWPAFNVADTAITLGVLTLLLVLERRGA